MVSLAFIGGALAGAAIMALVAASREPKERGSIMMDRFVTELARAKRKHDWDGYSVHDMVDKLDDEREELDDAIASGNIYGTHGVVNEAMHNAVVAYRIAESFTDWGKK